MTKRPNNATAFIARGRSLSCRREDVIILIPGAGGEKGRYQFIGEAGDLRAGTEIEMEAGEVARLTRAGFLVNEDPELQAPAALRASLMPAA
ncbi:MAG TPA: hypothetical protein VNR39_12415 [Pseudolabrys sp.]|nr:hypothetical protein [Pseudolabrys sp.]